ncbi:MAG TPA: GNAT family N-acetyltransferase [Deltaproteobacteria bacterium]|nr:GNAT family N-acetyltransferase [Deltaproteobacteria bacterium]
MNWRFAEACDLPLLAKLNRVLIRDEGAQNPMTLPQLEERMRVWLGSPYRAVLFEEGSTTVGYALFRSEEEGVHLRQFLIARDVRRRGYGREGLQILLEEVWPKGVFVTVEVLHHNESALAFWRSVGFRDHARTLKIHT